MIYLREVNINDALDLYEITSDKSVTEYLSWNPHSNISETKSVINNFYLKKLEDYKINSQAIVYKENNKVIGIIDVGNTDDLIQIGYFLNKNYWNKGIMTEALDKFLNILFNKLNYDIIHISHNVLNEGSKYVILKNKFKYLKTDLSYIKIKDTNYKTNYYYLKKEDYNGK